MNHRGEITTAWGDGEYTFRLTVAGAIELEEKCDAPFAVIFGRLNQGAFKINDVRETIRLGLIGGGLPAVDAKKLVDRYCEPLSENLNAARLVLAGLMFGFEAHPLGNQPAAPATESESPNVSTPPPSTEQDCSLEAALSDWTKLASGNSMPL